MLIKVFGYWINPKRVTSIRQISAKTRLHFSGSYPITYDGRTCDEVAEEINKQLKQPTETE